MKMPCLRLSLWVLLSFTAFCNSELIAADAPGVTAYISTGDNQWVLWLPMDSKASIDTAIDTAARDFHVTRLWWRGGGDEANLTTPSSEGLNVVLRPANHFFWAMFQWTKQCLEERGLIALPSLPQGGTECPSIRFGEFTILKLRPTAADVSNIPNSCSNAFRLQHPEWIPVNKYGTRQQNGPLEFAYPQCRAAVAKALADSVDQGGFDGLCLYTYNENFTLRYPDEFGFSPPVVDEFKNRFGVDIRTQSFDKEAWARLRGEYFTAFLAELKADLATHQKKLTVWLSAMIVIHQ